MKMNWDAPRGMIWLDRLRASRTADEVGLNSTTIFLLRYFKLKERNTTIRREIHCGFLHFISVAFILSVNSILLSENAGYQSNKVAAATALSTGISCLICGALSNLPFVLAPTTSTSLYFALYLQNRGMNTKEGNMAVLLLAVLFTLCGFRPVALFITNIIPFVMKVGVCLGVGLLIALEALYEIGLVKTGEHTILDMGQFNTEIYIAMLAFITIGLALHYRIRGAFLIGMLVGTFLYWLAKGNVGTWPPDNIILHVKDLQAHGSDISLSSGKSSKVLRLVFDLYVIGVILLNGLAHGLAETAQLRRADSTLPRGKWLYFSCGVGTLLSALMGSGPIMISPESAPGIKAGARTGLATMVCGCCFLLSLLFCPLFAAVPSSGTSPILLMIGMFMFENAGKVDWSNISEALPVFVMAIFVPFTYSIFNGVLFGFSVYVILLLCTGQSKLARRIRCWKNRKIATALSRGMRHIGGWTSWDDVRSNSDARPDSTGGDGGGLYSKLTTTESDTVTVNLYHSPPQAGSSSNANGDNSSGGRWKTLSPMSGTDDDDNDDDGIEEDEVPAKTLSFSLSAIGDELKDSRREDAFAPPLPYGANFMNSSNAISSGTIQMRSNSGAESQPQGNSNISGGGVIDLETASEVLGSNNRHVYSSFSDLAARSHATAGAAPTNNNRPQATLGQTNPASMSGPWGRRVADINPNNSTLECNDEDIEVVL